MKVIFTFVAQFFMCDSKIQSSFLLILATFCLL